MIKTHIPARPRNKKIIPTGGASISPSISSAVGSSHTHNNKSLLDLINQGNINVLSKLFVDESDNLYTTQNFYSQQNVSAYGIGSGGSGGGGDISKLPSWAGYTPAMVDYYVSAGLLVPFYNDMQARVSDLEGGVPPSQHNHTISEIAGLQGALDGKVDDSQVLTNVPANAKFTDTVYTHPASHPISMITGLQTALDGKASSTHTHSGVYEPVLGNPTINGYLLSSTTTGTRSWVKPYALPTASASVLGGVKIGANVSIASGVISVHNPLTIGTANGLSLSTQQLSLALATTTQNGALSATDKVYINLLRTFFEHDITNNAIKALKPLYSVGEVSAYGLGSGGSGGGTDISKLLSWAGYTSVMADYYVPASLVVPFRNDTLSRLTSLESGSATSIVTTGSGNAVTSLTKSGSVITANKGLTFALASHTHTIAQITGLQGILDLKAVGGLTVNFTSTSSLNNTLNGMVSGAVGGPMGGSSVVGFWTTLDSNKNFGGGFFTRYDRAFTLSKEDGVIQSWQELAYLTDNVASATKLQTARTIAGVSFDGSANIDIPFGNLVSKPTTISGYGITDAYTKAEVNSISETITTALNTHISNGTANAKHLTDAQLAYLNDLIGWWKVDASGNLYTEKNLYSQQNVSAYGVGSGSGGGTDISKLLSWAGYTSAMADYYAPASLLVPFYNDMQSRVGAIENTDYAELDSSGKVLSSQLPSYVDDVIEATSLSAFPLTGESGKIYIAQDTNKTYRWTGTAYTEISASLALGETSSTAYRGDRGKTAYDHTSLSNNPHGVTASQVGSYTIAQTNTSIANAISAIEIGGRNLIKNSSEEWVTVTTTTAIFINNFFSTTVLEAEQEYTFSWESEIVSGTPSGGVSIGCGTTTYQRDILYSNVPIVGNNKVTFKPTSADLATHKSFAFRWRNNGAVFTFRYRKLKLEKGTIATDWTPAPEDQVSDWSTTDVTSFSYIKNKPTQLSQFIDNIGVATHIANTSNPHSVTKAQVGLSNVDNTSDAGKPISTATQTALNLKLNKSVFDDLFEKVEVSTGVYAIKAKYNFYGVGEVSAYGLGSGGSGGGIDISKLQDWAGYTSAKADYYVPASLLVPFRADTLSRLTSLESGSALTFNTDGAGNAITAISKSGTTVTATKGATFSLSTHLHTGIYEPIFTKNNAFNKSFGTTVGTVAEGNDSRIINGQTAFGWGDHATAGYALNSAFNTHDNDNIRHITGAERTKWDGVVTDFGNLEIGGRNLLILNPIFWQRGSISSTTGVVGSSTTRLANITGNEIGGAMPYVVEFYSPHNIFLFFYDENDNYLGFNGWLTERTFGVTPAGTKKVKFGVAKSDDSTIVVDDILDVKIKLEKGDKATDWSPAPEDQVPDWLTTDVNSFSFIKNKPTSLSQFTDNIGVATHITNTSNPHSVTKAQVGLGNVDNTADSAKNVLSASKLSASRTIWGQSFDGTGNVTGALSGATTGSFTGDVTVNTLNISSTAGVSHIAFSRPALNYITAPLDGGISFLTNGDDISLSNSMLVLSPNGNVGVGKGFTNNTTAITAQLHVRGNILATGATTTTKVIFNAAGWSLEQVGTEIQYKYNGVVKQRMLSDGSIVATGEVTAFVSAT